MNQFHLEVQQVDKFCLFKLSWGQGQQLNAQVYFPEELRAEYQEWHDCYLKFYKTSLRGRVGSQGTMPPPAIDWHAKLVEAEAKLLSEFHQWLRSGDLYDIRSILEDAIIELKQDSAPLDLFLTCNHLDLERLPWEAWEIKKKVAAKGKIRIVRKPWNIQEPIEKPQKGDRKARVLAILGDDTGLDFQAEKEALKSLNRIATIEFVGWQPGKNIEVLRSEIVRAISDERGWDILFFAGHSNETALTGGEIAIAPDASLCLTELAPALKIAKEQGLQFALFNSCNGLSLAKGLINLGLSQVAVMREPVHNLVAEEFLVRFLQRLAEYADVHEALLSACQYLKLEKHLTYPSASLIPSLFRHPHAELFRFKPLGLIHKIKPWLPGKKEAIALGIFALISWQLPVQSFLLQQRVLTQARYRQFTKQGLITTTPPVLLVEIDEESIQKAKISNPIPMDRNYLAKLVDKFSSQKAKVIGFDYLLDRYQQENDQKLANSIQTAVQNQGTWFIFASTFNNDNKWSEVRQELAHPNWSLQGNMSSVGENLVYMRTAPIDDAPFRRPPFAYMLALAYHLNSNSSTNPPFPQLKSSTNLLDQVKYYSKNTKHQDYKNLFSAAARVQPLTHFSYLQLSQMWLQPIFDFSIPPEQVYQSIPAWKLLESSSKLQQEIVLIAPGGHIDAGITGRGEDNLPLPPALKYWRTLKNPNDLSQWFPGGGAHAYMIHHFLNQRIVTPIPDLWLVIIAAFLGKGVIVMWELNEEKQSSKKQPFLIFSLNKKGRSLLLLTGTTAIYGLASLQLYITAAAVLPWVLPMATFWSFILLYLSQKQARA